MARPTKNNPQGKQKRSKLTPETIKKLEEVFSMDGSVPEACYYANISEPTYYAWIKENPALEEQFKRLKQRPILKARQIVMQRMSDSYQNAMDYLKRKKRLEFGDNIDVTSEGDKIIPIYGGKSNNIQKHDSNSKNISTK
jgi:hypothetical protein